MKNRFIILIFAVCTILVMGVYFLINPSYERSIRAKYYYELGDYSEAYSLAKEAFGMNTYNRMAATIMTQSQTSLKYVNYINDAKKYMNEIDALVSQEEISDANKAKIKIICEIMTGSYVKLAPSVVTDDDLVQEAAKYYSGFEKLLEKVNN